MAEARLNDIVHNINDFSVTNKTKNKHFDHSHLYMALGFPNWELNHHKLILEFTNKKLVHTYKIFWFPEMESITVTQTELEFMFQYVYN